MPTLAERRLHEWKAPTAGLVTAVSPRDLPPNALSRCENFDLDRSAGRLTRRPAWTSTAFAPDSGILPVAVFELPATEPPGAPSTPRVVVALFQGAPPTVGLIPFIWRFYMRPHFTGTVWETSSWGLLGSVDGFSAESAPDDVSASVVGQDGAYRIYLSYGQAATDAPNQTISMPAWIGFIPTSRRRFKPSTSAYRSEDVGPNKFLAQDLRLLPPPTSLLTVQLLSTGRSGETLRAGGRFYRIAYKYDGFQIGALSNAITLDIPEEDGTFVEATVRSHGIVTIGRRVTHLLVFVQEGVRIEDGPGAYGLIETVDLDTGPTSKADSVVTDSSVTDKEPVLTRTLGIEPDPSIDSWNQTPVENLRTGHDDDADPWNREQLYMFDVGPDGLFATVVRRHFHVEASPGRDWLYRTEKIVKDQNSTWAMSFGSPTLDPNTDGSTLLVPGIMAANRLSVRFSATAQNPDFLDFVRSILAVNDFLLAWDYPYQVGRVDQLRPFRAKPFGRVKSFVSGIGPPAYLDVEFYNALPAEPGVQVGVYWMRCRPAGLLPQYSTVVNGLSYVVATAPIFGADTGGTPTSDMLVTLGAVTFKEPQANLKATDGTIMLFDSTAAYPSGTETLNGALVSYGATGWRHDDPSGDWATTTFIDTTSDLSQLTTYEELAQDTSLTPWLRASAVTRVGRQHFAGDLAIPLPTDRLTTAKDTLQRYQIGYSGISGESQVMPDFFPPTNVFSVGEGTAPIQWMGEWFGRLVVLTDESCYVVAVGFGNAAQTQVERRFHGYGCVAPRSAVLTPNGPIWLGRQGVVGLRGEPELLSRSIHDDTFKDDIRARGRSAIGAWDAVRSAYMLWLPGTKIDSSIWILDRNGAWSSYTFPFRVVALAQDSSSSGVPSGIAEITTSTYGLVEPNLDVSDDLGSLPITATAEYPEVEPAGGDRLAHILEASIEFAGSVQFLALVDGSTVANNTFSSIQAGHGRLPVASRGRFARLVAQAFSRDSYVERVALEAVAKGRLRS